MSSIYNGDEPVNIPDLTKLTKEIIDFLDYVNKPDMLKMQDDEPRAFELHLESKFENFVENYYSTFKMLLDKKDRSKNVLKLMQMINTIKKVKDGQKSYDNAFNQIKENLAEEFIYSKYGGKDNFEKQLKENRN